MSKSRRIEFRPGVTEVLEDRVVPSTTASTAPSTTSSTTNLVTELNQIGAQVNAAYAGFATSVREAETSLAVTGDTAANLATVANEIAGEIATLQQGITAAVQGQAGSGTLALLDAQLTGNSPGSLSSTFSADLAASTIGSADGSIPQASLPLLIEAVEGAMAASYTSTAVEIYLYATGQASTTGTSTTGTSTTGTSTTTTGSTSGGSSGTSIDTGDFSTAVNAAYSGFASSVRAAEVTLITSSGSTATGTPTTAATTIDQSVGTLVSSLGSLLTNTTAAADESVISAEFIGPAGSLETDLNTLVGAVAAGTTDGSVSQASLPLLFASVDAAIAASYSATAVDGYLITNSI